jgi:peptidoglycan/LPS O-acetylase OafA/YrhL
VGVNPGYRSDVDGLRALAVVAVIVFHADAAALSGGFAGVDIFFVISGFLISGQISRDVELGRFTFRQFYTRRIKRILPVYAAVSLSVSIASLFLLSTSDLVVFTTSLSASWLFASNVFFALFSTGYFDQRFELFPLLHTWSLGVEEQFYFVFPLLFVLMLRQQRSRAIGIGAVLAVAFVVLSQIYSSRPSTYYLLQFRAHELLLGMLSYLAIQTHPITRAPAANVLWMAGAVLMAASLFLLNPKSEYPGINSLYPCMGACLVIYSGERAAWFRPLLTNRAIVFIGLISYSLYLWHWPVFALLRYRGIDLSPPTVAAAFVAILAVSILSWRFIEKPVRENRAIGFPMATGCFFILPTTLFVAFGVLSYRTGGIPQRYSPEIREMMLSYSREADLSRTCAQRYTDRAAVGLDILSERCAFGDVTQPKADILLFGDSHANHFKPFLDVLAQKSRRRALYHVMGSCAPSVLPGIAQAAEAADILPCEQHNAGLLRIAGNFRFVVLAGEWSAAPGGMEAGLSKAVDDIERAGATAVVFRDSPGSDRDMSQCVLYRARGWLPAAADCNIPLATVRRMQAAENGVIDRIKASRPDMIVIDPGEVMCSAAGCITQIGNLAVYRDRNHINEQAARALALAYLALKGNPLDRPPAGL